MESSMWKEFKKKKKKGEEAMDVKRPRKLNFNVPLLSVRRPGSMAALEFSRTTSQQALRDTTDRVPFSWEQAPGKPKDLETSCIDNGGHDQHHPEEATDHDNGGYDQHYGPEDCCDGDVDDGDDDDDDDDNDNHEDADDDFLDAIEMFSLSEPIDIVEPADQKVQGTLVDGAKMEIGKSTASQSTNFIIQRFLPAANALVVSSALALFKNLNRKLPKSRNYPEDYVARAVRSYDSPKSCGLQVFCPWSTKHKLSGVKSPASWHKLCGVKNPVRQGLQDSKPQRNARQMQN